MKKTIRGAGGGGKGGGGGGRTPVEAEDSLQSKAYVKVLDLVGEGEIEGLVNGFRSIYIDGTPLQNADGTYNFNGLELDFRNGIQSQTVIPDFNTTESERAVGVEITVPNPVIRTITNSAIDAIGVRISFPQLTSQNPKNGDIEGAEVSFMIERQTDGGGYQTVVVDTVIGKSTSKYERRYRVDLPGDGPWDIRVSRLTPDSTTVALQNATFWESYTEIVDGKFTYPNSAIVGMKIDASQFSAIPTRGYDMKLLRVKVPINYNPVTRAYSGVWDGSFYVAWTDNPAWIFYDILTSTRYGLGSFIPEAQIDKWSLYEIAQYCDELVPNGFGGTEPRFTCNAYIQSQQDAYKVLQDLASTFRGMSYWANGALTVAQDSPSDPAFLFSEANVVDGLFTYQGSSAKTRHTVALVTWNDPEDLYRQKIEYVEDAAAIARYGVIETQVVAFGCTSRGQANRVGRWLLYTEQYQTETVAFRTGLNGATVRPGQIIKIADRTRAGQRRAGRIVSSTTTSITVDSNISFNPATHVVSAMMPDGSVEERQINTANARLITVSTPFSAAPVGVWMVSSAAIEAQLFKVISISEADDGTHDITAIAHDPSKYGFIEEGLALEPRSISSLTLVPESPAGLAITETLYEVNGEIRVKVTFSWNYVVGASTYLVTYSRDSLNPITLPVTSSNDVEILNAEPGEYFLSVTAISALNIRSVPSTTTGRVLGRAAPPQDVEGFSLFPLAGVAYLSWEKSTDLDVLLGGSVRIRHTPLTMGAAWRNAVDIVPALAGTATRAQVPLLPGTYMAKFVDTSNVASINEAIILTTVPTPLNLNVVETVVEDPDFAGARDGVIYVGDYDGIALDALASVDEIPVVDEVVAWDFAGGVRPEGVYDFDNVVDLGEVFSSRVTARILAESLDVTDSIDQREDLVDDWIDLDGDFIDTVNAELFIQTTLDDPASIDAEWTVWKRFFVGEYRARGLRFQLRLTSEITNHNIIIKELSVTVDMPDRIINLENITSSAVSFTQITYDGAFRETPASGITAYNLNSGDYYQITDENNEGFRITFYDSSNAIVARRFNVIAKGYGLQA